MQFFGRIKHALFVRKLLEQHLDGVGAGAVDHLVAAVAGPVEHRVGFGRGGYGDPDRAHRRFGGAARGPRDAGGGDGIVGTGDPQNPAISRATCSLTAP